MVGTSVFSSCIRAQTFFTIRLCSSSVLRSSVSAPALFRFFFLHLFVNALSNGPLFLYFFWNLVPCFCDSYIEVVFPDIQSRCFYYQDISPPSLPLLRYLRISPCWAATFALSLEPFLDAFSHLYKRVGPFVGLSVGHTRVEFLIF